MLEINPAFSESWQIFMIWLFARIFNGFYLFSQKRSIVDSRQSSKWVWCFLFSSNFSKGCILGKWAEIMRFAFGIFNPFVHNAPFLYPLRTSENIGNNWLKRNELLGLIFGQEIRWANFPFNQKVFACVLYTFNAIYPNMVSRS